jgi:hypothetical protein
MGAERLIFDGKARTAQQHCLPFPLCCRQSGLLGSRPRSGTTKKDLLRSKPQKRNLSQASVTESSVALPPATGSTTMTTSAFSLRSDASAFDPDNIRILSNAFEDAWQSLQPPGTTFHLDGQADQAREILARCIIEMAKLGERDQRQLRDAARVHLAEANIRHARN